MTKNVKTVFRNFDYLHADDFAKYLEEMAAKGWHFKSWGAGLKFERKAPEEVRYAVEIFSGADDSDYRANPKTEEFAEFCEAVGWEFVDAKRKFCIFKQVREEAVEIQTDEERLKNILKGIFAGDVIWLLMWSFSLIRDCMGIFGASFGYGIFSKSAWLGLAFCLVWWLLTLGSLIYKLSWKLKKEKELKEGKKLYFGTGTSKGRKDGTVPLMKELGFLFLTISLYFFGHKVFFFIMLSFMAALYIYDFVMNKLRPDSNHVEVVQGFMMVGIVFLYLTIIVYNMSADRVKPPVTQAPLVISDYETCEDRIESIKEYKDENWLGSRMSYILSYEPANYLMYEVYHTGEDWILKRIWEEKTDAAWFKEAVACDGLWGAKEAYVHDGDYYVLYEDAILFLSRKADAGLLTKEQVQRIQDKLDLR